MAILKVINNGYSEEGVYDRVINYIFRKDNPYRKHFGFQYVYFRGPQSVALQFRNIADYYMQPGKVLLYHFVVSFSLESEGWVYHNPRIAWRIIFQAMGELPYAAFWCLHGDTENLHAHIAMSPVNLETGLKYPNRRGDYRHLANRIFYYECFERQVVGKLYEKTYGFYPKEEAYTEVPRCTVIYGTPEDEGCRVL